MRGFGVLALSAAALVGCATSSSGGMSADVVRQTAGPATLAAFADLCGTPAEKLDRYTESYIGYAKNNNGATEADVTKMRDMFARGRADVRTRFPTDADVKEQCTKYPTNQSVLDRGIAGDFTGQI